MCLNKSQPPFATPPSDFQGAGLVGGVNMPPPAKRKKLTKEPGVQGTPVVSISTSLVVATQIFFIFPPDPWGNDPIWRAFFFKGFSKGLVQPPTRHLSFFRGYLERGILKNCCMRMSFLPSCTQFGSWSHGKVNEKRRRWDRNEDTMKSPDMNESNKQQK